jgi:hypothetical protein
MSQSQGQAVSGMGAVSGRRAEVLALRQKLAIVPNGQGHLDVTDCSNAAKVPNGGQDMILPKGVAGN